MKKAILRGNFAVICVSLVCALLLAAFMFNYRMTQKTQQDLLNMAQVAALSLETGDDAQAIAQSIGDKVDVRVSVIASDGTVLADTEANAEDLPNHMNRTEIQQAKQSGSGTDVRNSDSLGEKLIYAAAKTPSGSYLRLSASYNSLVLDLVAFAPMLAIGLIAGVVAAIPLANKQSAAVTAPIAQLSRELSAIKNGGTPLQLHHYPYPELRAMAQDINQLSMEISGNLQRLQAEKEKIDYILDNMSEGFLLLDEQEKILTINEAACSFFGCHRMLVQGKELSEATSSKEILQAADNVIHAQQDSAQGQMKIAGRRTIHAAVSRVREGDGGLSKGAIMILTDITEQTSTVKMRQEFFQSASHELKTPITSIRGFAELLCSDVPLDETSRKDFSSRILKEAGRMSHLIEDIIMISRMESGDITFEKKRVNLADVVKESEDFVRGLAAQRNITLDVATQNCSYFASHREMSELFSNLLVNAVRYNYEGGLVRATLTREQGRPVFSVFNTGDPIPEKYRQRIFERFFRIDKGRSKESGGTGLGLAIVKHVAVNYGIDVELQVEENGNRFVLKF